MSASADKIVSPRYHGGARLDASRAAPPEFQALFRGVASCLEFKDWTALAALAPSASVCLNGTNQPYKSAVFRLAELLQSAHDITLALIAVQSIPHNSAESRIHGTLRIQWDDNETWTSETAEIEVYTVFALSLALDAPSSTLLAVEVADCRKSMPRPVVSHSLQPKRSRHDKVLVCTIATKDHPGLQRLRRSCTVHGLDLQVFGKGAPARGSSYYKLKTLYWNLRARRNDFEYIFYTDAFDSLVLSGLDVILKQFKGFATPLLMSAEANCFPVRPGMGPNDYPDAPTRYRYLNAGGLIANVDYLVSLLESLNVAALDEYESDQAWWIRTYLSNCWQIKLDHCCQIFQCLILAEEDLMIQSGQFVNRLTGSSPCVLHGNGGTPIPTLADLYLEIHDDNGKGSDRN
jgi:hypothetical protein